MDLPFLNQFYWDDIVPVRLALAELLKEDLKADDHWREESKWIVELDNETDKVPLGRVKVISEFG